MLPGSLPASIIQGYNARVLLGMRSSPRKVLFVGRHFSHSPVCCTSFFTQVRRPPCCPKRTQAKTCEWHQLRRKIVEAASSGCRMPRHEAQEHAVLHEPQPSCTSVSCLQRPTSCVRSCGGRLNAVGDHRRAPRYPAG